MPAYIVGVYRHPSREAAERADRRYAPWSDAESADTKIHDAPPVILAGLVKGGEYASAAEFRAGDPREVLCVSARGRIMLTATDADDATFPLTWYRYPEAP